MHYVTGITTSKGRFLLKWKRCYFEVMGGEHEDLLSRFLKGILGDSAWLLLESAKGG